MRSSRILIAAVAVGVVLCACTPTPVVTPTPTPTPTFACTPEAGGTPAPCSQAEFEEMKAKDALYAEAEALYRRTVNLRNLVYRGQPPTDLETLAVGEALAQLRSDLGSGYQLRSGEFAVLKVQRQPDRSREGSAVALLACLDSASVELYQGESRIQLRPRGLERTYYRQVEGKLLVTHIESWGQTEC